MAAAAAAAALGAFARRAPATSSSPAARPRRGFHPSRTRRADDAAVPSTRPVGAFRASVFGFLLGTVLAGAGMYYYVVDEYRVSNALLTEDVYALQSAVTRLEGYVKGLETEVKGSKEKE